LDQLENADDPANCLMPMELAVEHLQSITLAADRVEKTRNGLSTRIADGDFANNMPIRMIDETGGLVAVGTFDRTGNAVIPKVVLL